MKRPRARLHALPAHDRLFFVILSVQTAALVVLVLIVGAPLLRYLEKSEAQARETIFREHEGLLTEVLYARQLTGREDAEERNPAFTSFLEDLRNKGVHAEAHLRLCGEAPSDGAKVYEFELGGTKLEKCLYLAATESPLRRIAEGSFILIAGILALELVFWAFFRGALEGRILRPLFREIEKQKLSAALGDQAREVAHDIRSPLAALEALSSELRVPDEQAKLLHAALGRIRGITASLLQKNRPSEKTGGREISHFGQALRNIVREKQFLLGGRGLAIEWDPSWIFEPYFLSIPRSDLERSLSNLVDNAFEAEPRSGRVKLVLRPGPTALELDIVDDGKGIPPELLARLGSEQVSQGKAGGHGLGVLSTRQNLERAGARLSIRSELGQGSCVTLVLPRVSVSPPLLARLEITVPARIIVLDDDSSQAEAIRQKLGPATELLHFESIEAFEDAGRPVATYYFVDYFLGPGRKTGLQWIQQSKLHARAVLHTSQFQDLTVLQACQAQEIRLLPKGLLADLELKLLETPPTAEAVLIDDDDLVHLLWDQASRSVARPLARFRSGAEFLARAGEFAKSTPIYCDQNLGGDEKGSELLPKLGALGFNSLILIGGDDAERLPAHPAYTISKAGKRPPWSAA